MNKSTPCAPMHLPRVLFGLKNVRVVLLMLMVGQVLLVGAQVPCNENTCASGQYCCNPSCSICAVDGGSCTQELCDYRPAGPRCGGGFCRVIPSCIRGICIDKPPVPCNENTCASGEKCCNPWCSICAILGVGGCTQQVCGPRGPSCVGGYCAFDELCGPNGCFEHNGGMEMDPHIKKWSGEWYDYMGSCDLVLVTAPSFHNGLGLDIHVRTTLRYSYSFISEAALKIGDEVMTVASWGEYFLNGVSRAELPALMSGFPVTHTKVNDKVHFFVVQIDDHHNVTFSTFKDFVNVRLNVNLEDSAGLMGDYITGASLARDGKTILEDANSFGQEWQVLESEPKLFQTNRSPQAPQRCLLPDEKAKAESRRRLGENFAHQAAEEACSKNWAVGKNIKACIHDVLATRDLEVALADAY